ncbi:MAG: hypothetical protein JWM05_513, partial [Acidimicrobiales bacterium]|nr:hypothetical protein [Acidimicrobiales bacterium]
MSVQSESSIPVSRDPAELARVREWLRQALAHCPSRDRDMADNVVLMASELATNAVVHTQCIATLTLAVDAGHVRVAVHDDDPRPAVLEPLNEHRLGGNGLRIVDAWADSWGTDLT